MGTWPRWDKLWNHGKTWFFFYKISKNIYFDVLKVKTYWLLLLKFISLVQLTLTKNDQLIMSAGMSCYFFWWHFLTDSDILYLKQCLFWNCPVLEPLLKHLEVTLLNNDSSAWRNYHFKFSFGPVYIKSGFWKVSFFAINISSNISWMWVIFLRF